MTPERLPVVAEARILPPEEAEHEAVYREAVEDARPLLEPAFRDAVAAADPAAAVLPHLPPPPSGRLLVVGAGKAAAAMARAVEDAYLQQGVSVEGVVVTRYGHGGATRAVRVVEAGHPVPDEAGARATAELLALVAGAGAEDHVIALLSGGGSALLCAPVDGITLDEERALTEALLRSGADIGEMNTVRRHLSQAKGGRLAAAAAPAPLTALVVSDVVGDDLATIASGPTVADPTTYADARAVLDRYAIDAPAARAVLAAGVAGEREETPKPDDPRLRHARTILVATNAGSLDAAAARLAASGVTPVLLSSELTGEAREVGRVLAAIAAQAWRTGEPAAPPCAFLSGGETTVTVRGPGGRGGRNSEGALALALALPRDAAVSALFADTDGIDGIGGHAGAFVTPALLRRLAASEARAALEHHDSGSFFAEAGHLFVTGPTGTNVNDLRIVLVHARREGA
jgi:glycerate 2-kinase